MFIPMLSWVGLVADGPEELALLDALDASEPLPVTVVV
jgi:hypothetical protein